MFGRTQNTSRQICEYYQKGSCKFGSRCWNIHTGGPGFGTTRNVFGGGSPATASPLTDSKFTAFVKQVQNEMNIWEKNGMWQLSCLAPLKEHPLLTGFADTSPEELRFEAYEARKSNSIASYEDQFRQKVDYHRMLREALKNQLPEAIEALKTVFYNSSSSNRNESSNVFGSNTAFASSSNTSSIFGGQQSSGLGTIGTGNSGANSIFSNQTSVFGSNSVFGASTNKGFGNVNSSVFNSNQPTKSLFGGNTQSNQPTNIFGSSNNQAQAGSIFGTQSLSSSSGPGIFGSNTISSASNTSNVFGSAPKFGALNQPQQSVFGAQSQTNQTSNFFGNKAVSSQPSNIFGQLSSTGTSGSIFGGGSNSINNSNTSAFTSNFSLNKFGTNNSTNIFATKSSVFQNSFNSQMPAQSSNIFNSAAISSDNVVSMESPNVETEQSISNPPSQPFSSSNIFQNQTVNTSVPSASSTSAHSVGFGVLQSSSFTPTIFGTPASTGAGAQFNTGAHDSSVSSIYTPLHLLSVEDKEEFERDVFLRIPIVPPPRELCV